MGTDLPRDLWAELWCALKCFELGCVLMEQSLALQPFCPCLHPLLAPKRRAEGQNNPPKRQLMGKGRATMGGGGAVSPALLICPPGRR